VSAAGRLAVTDGAAAVRTRGERPWPLVTFTVLAFNRRDAVRVTLPAQMSQYE